MALAGYTLHPNGFFYKEDNSGPYQISADDTPYLLDEGLPGTVRTAASLWSYAAAASGLVNTTPVTIAPAVGAGIRSYITSIQLFATALTAATELVIRNGSDGTVLWRTKIGTAGLTAGIQLNLPSPLFSTANTLLEIVLLTSPVLGSVYFNAQGFVDK